MQQLSREFVTVADEAYMLYPEDEWNLKRVADAPQHRFFKAYGERMPEGDWHHPGTKQGLYMIGPDGEYLEGRFAASGLPDDITARLERALERWQTLRKEKGYANKAVPRVVSSAPPEVADRPFVLRVHSRDLPRHEGQQCRFDPARDQQAGWMDFTRWAWNENWLALDDGRALVPDADGPQQQPVDPRLVRRIAQQVLIDNVRGQAGTWPETAVKHATLTMERGPVTKGRATIVYRGEVELDDGQRSIRAELYGEGLYEPKVRDLERFELVALGTRTGAHTFNQRNDDRGPAPIGFAIVRWRPEPLPKEPGANVERRQR
ncbi:MAG: hypothetical protein H6835_03020 [Planctomycetes bacterium]|nr:hypothetical protein [Planctomycetota bacterium]